MKFATLSLLGATGRDGTSKLGTMGAWWVRFGEDIFTYAPANKWRSVASAFGGVEAQGDVRKGDVHLVVQKGRTFQLEHPDIPVLMNKGRYLVVEIDSATGKRLASRADPCFHIEPLRENSVVFEIVTPEAKMSPPPAIVRLVDDLSLDTLEKTMSTLVSFPTRHSTSPEFRDAAAWARDSLTKYGANAELVEIDVSGTTSWNVVARKPGTATDRGEVLVVAHLDSVNAQDGPAAPAPGADDNASGSAGLLTLAEAMGKQSFDHDLVFVLFGGEEQGLHGSIQYVSAMDASDRARIRAVLNMDMIGSVNSDPQSVLLEGAELSQATVDGLAAAAAQFTSLSVQTSLNPFASDHVPFIRAGIPSVLTIEGADGANEAIHTANDVLSRINPHFAMEILRMNAAYLAAEAGIAEVAAVSEQPSDSKPVSCCGCSGQSTAQPPEEVVTINQLRAHYLALFAQYVRLHRDSRLTQYDFSRWRQTQTAYDAVMAAVGRTSAPGR